MRRLPADSNNKAGPTTTRGCTPLPYDGCSDASRRDFHAMTLPSVDTSDPINYPYTFQTCVLLDHDVRKLCTLPLLWFHFWFGGDAGASVGERLPEFKECLAVCGPSNNA